jgi:polysaccharide deacetylase family protein (PEP-CTERM system associated)
MNILTVDLEDWFHILDFPGTSNPSSWNKMESRIENNCDRLLKLFEESNLKATWFSLGWVAKKYPELIRKISSKHEIACHSVNHQLLYQMTPDEVRLDIRENIALLEDVTGKKVNTYRAPGFSFTPETKWIVEILKETGIEYDCSIFPSVRNHGGYNSFPVSKPCRVTYRNSEIKEFPMNTGNFLGKRIVFSGGGYFRLLPYAMVSGFMRKSPYVMTYFHPRDFDPDQPVLKDLSMKRKFMSYTGLKKSFSSLNRLVNEFKFVSVEEAANMINWNDAPLIKLENY